MCALILKDKLVQQDDRVGSKSVFQLGEDLMTGLIRPVMQDVSQVVDARPLDWLRLGEVMVNNLQAFDTLGRIDGRRVCVLQHNASRQRGKSPQHLLALVSISAANVDEENSVIISCNRAMQVLLKWEHIEPALLPHALERHVLVEGLLVPRPLREPLEKVQVGVLAQIERKILVIMRLLVGVVGQPLWDGVVQRDIPLGPAKQINLDS